MATEEKKTNEKTAKALKTKAEKKAEQKKTAKISRERLQRITKTRKHYVRNAARIVKHGSRSLARNIWLSIAAIAIMAITILILSITLIATSVMDTIVDELESQIDVSIYIKQGASEDKISEIKESILKLESVVSVSATTPEEANTAAIKKMISDYEITNQDLIDNLYGAPNKIPWIINVQLASLNDLSELEDFVNSDDQIQRWLDSKPPSYSDKNREAINNISNTMNNIKLVGLVAAAVFAVIAILVVFNTIRMAIFNRKEEIYMMKLVGASRGFIRGPFLVEASWYGIFAAVIAAAIIYPLVYFVSTSQQFGSMVAPTFNLMQQYWYFVIAAQIVVGILIGVFSALLATRKYLRKL